jgi:hypothetical protein
MDQQLFPMVSQISNFLDVYGPFGGQVISITKYLCAKAAINCEPRIVEGMF